MTRLEAMEKLKANIDIDVIISTAGEGSRLHKINSQINKSLLPFKNKPIIYYIVEKIPTNLKICVLLGYRAEQVRDFLTLAFPDREIKYMYVDDWSSIKSGTRYSLLVAKRAIQKPFWYFPCDGTFEDVDFMNFEYSEDVYVVSKVKKIKAPHYLTFNIKNRRISKQFFKSTEESGAYAFTGVMKISNIKDFFTRLEKSNSREFTSAILDKSLTYSTNKWKDFGNSDIYEEQISNSGGFDFSKTGEYTYQLEDKIIKWWSDSSIPEFKLEKPRLKPEVFPKRIHSLNQFLTYTKSTGCPFYEKVNKENFNYLLDWLQNRFWSQESLKIENNLLNFYKNKTLSRIELLGDKRFQPSYNPTKINGVNVQSWHTYLKKVNWDLLIEINQPSFIHGDLQFDNIIFNSDTNEFTLIDWRHDFAGLKSVGDLYYDFAKIMGGIYLNYFEIKQGKFNFNYKNGEIFFKLPVVNQSTALETELITFTEKLGLNFMKVRELVPLIFWNMAPLHKEPFANLCWSLGILHYEWLN
jgi:choline kinase